MRPAAAASPPCVLHEDDDVLVVLKPAGWSTHASTPHGSEGIYDWLHHREPRWASLAIVHRLDRDTSGVMVFAKSRAANRSLTAQFAGREVDKRYVLLTDRAAPVAPLRVESRLRRAGSHYIEAGAGEEGDVAVTEFAPAAGAIAAHPVTGRTHQIRVQAAARGFPVLGDALYGGSPAPRLMLHAQSLAFRHPATGERASFESSPDFGAEPRAALREAFIDDATNAWRVAHGAPDGWPGARVDRLGDYLLFQSERDCGPEELRALEALGARGIYAKRLSRQVRRLDVEEASPRLVAGEPAPARFEVRENGVRYELGLAEGYSVGLFLDQRDNRRRFLTGHVAAEFPSFASGRTVLNAFAYTCAFSVCAALAGAEVTSLDLSRKYLDWGRRNFALNGLDSTPHDFIYGDAFDWFRRLARKGRLFDVVVLDPPTFSQTGEGKRFSAERDYRRLVAAALPLLASGGVLLACSNAARVAPAAFLESIRTATRDAGRRVVQEHYVPQPPDFPIGPGEPAYLKTVWLRIA
jgi:23S rRNA (cytosine1962-C5)-methyltransferase